MKLKLIKILGKGNYWQECLILEVLQDCDIGMHCLSRLTRVPAPNKSERAAECKDVYVFSNQSVRKGDLIWLYTCNGGDETVIQTAQITIYTFYWGLPGAVWNNEDGIMLIEAADVTSKLVEAL
jgi:hypothetical protein